MRAPLEVRKMVKWFSSIKERKTLTQPREWDHTNKQYRTCAKQLSYADRAISSGEPDFTLPSFFFFENRLKTTQKSGVFLSSSPLAANLRQIRTCHIRRE